VICGTASGGSQALLLLPTRLVQSDSLGIHVKPSIAALEGDGEVCVWSGPEGIHWSRSSDSGQSWCDGGSGLDAGGGMADRPRIIALPGDSLLLCAWDELGDGGVRRVRSALSADAGCSFLPPMDLSGEAGHSLGVDLAAGRGGRIVATWMLRLDHDFDVVAALSTDSGRTWSTPLLIDDAPLTDQFAPSVAMTAHGRIYIAWESYDDPGGDADVYVIRSDDFGASFGSRTLVHPTTSGNQWSPSIAAADSLVWVAYVDDRIGDDDLFVSFSQDAGESWQTIPYPLGGPGHGLQWNPRLRRAGPQRALLTWEVLALDNSFSVQLGESKNGGTSWSYPVEVAARGRTPSVALRGDGRFCVVWSGEPAADSWLIWGAPGNSFPMLPALRRGR
jgi:hypothetical protein